MPRPRIPDDAVLINRHLDETWYALETLRRLRRDARGSHYVALSLAIKVLDNHYRDVGNELGRVNRQAVTS